MMWFFGVLVVLLIGAVAVVAAGGGDPLSPTYDDRRDVLVPAQRPLGPEDLTAVRFTTAIRGYRTSEVDALLDRLTAQLAAERAAREGQAEATDSPEPEVEAP